MEVVLPVLTPPQNLVEAGRHGGGGVMVWAAVQAS